MTACRFGSLNYVAPMLRFPLAIFLSAFLLFQVQPIIGKYILPWFGGSAAIWTTCMLFFQVGLLGGYAYAHWLGGRRSTRLQGVLHGVLLAASLLLVPHPDGSKPAPGVDPTTGILLLLLLNVGAPFFLLSTTGPLLQRWFSLSFPGKSPYRLYALSNAGSLLALLSYPFLVEPYVTLATQLTVWRIGYAAFVVLGGWCAVRIALQRNPAEVAGTNATANDSEPAARRPSWLDLFFWLALATCGSAMLLATTNQLCHDVAVVPFLWIVPLVLYLLTFIICFDNPRWYDRRWFGLLLAVSLPLTCTVLFIGVDAPLWVQIVVFSVAMFACCMTCHGELVRSKPHPLYLTVFYLMVAAGGALGGLLVAVAAPALFSGYFEYHLALAGCCLLTLISWWRDPMLLPAAAPSWAVWTVLSMAVIAMGALFAALGGHAYYSSRDSTAVYRNFYGVLHIVDTSNRGFSSRRLVHGRIGHGFQFKDEDKRRLPTSYYAPQSGVGMAIRLHPQREKRGLRIGVVGLGTGTLAAWAREQDYIRFYEINPQVLALSKELGYFTYLRDCPTRPDVQLGDARVRMEQELDDNQPQRFDVLAVDAFSSDAIPIHLLTAQCADIYRRHLASDGLLAIHISNRYLDLSPVTRGMARRLGWSALRVSSSGDLAGETAGAYAATWILLTRNEKFLAAEEVTGKLDENGKWEIYSRVTPWSLDDRPPLLWTDDFASLLQVVD